MPDNKIRGQTGARRGVFISYARSDGESFARELRQRLEGESIPLWQDRVGLEGGRDWWLQINEALEQVEFMVLVMTPNALKSEIVRKEWRYARHQGVCVYPVKGADKLDFAALPRAIRDTHFYDLDVEWKKFVNDLNTRCQIPRVPFMVEDLPKDFVPRPDELKQLTAYLLDEQREEPIAITAALRGAGGYGKTTLARALCHDDAIQDAFDDGILWVSIGQNPSSLIGTVEDLIYTLSGEHPDFTNIDIAAMRLGELLVDRDMLLVIDDVWNEAHLKPFMQGGKRCARLITTRNLDILPPNTRGVIIDAMHGDEAVVLLGSGLPGGNEKDLRALAARLGYWPLLLKLANGMLRARALHFDQSLPDALSYVNRALEKRGLTFFDARNALARDQAVALTIGASFDLLTPDERERYGELAVFPEDVDVPLATLAKLWNRTGGLDEFDTEELCERLFRLSLLLLFDPTERSIRLHDVIRSYLIHSQRGKLPMLHQQLLDAHRPVLAPSRIDADSNGWHALSHDEPYLWDHLVYHLSGADLAEEILATVKDLRYISEKAFVRRAASVEMDLTCAEGIAPGDVVVSALRRGVSQASHVLNRCHKLEDLKVTLYSRLLHLKEIKSFTEKFADTLSRPYITARFPLPDLPKSPLIRTLSGHKNTVTDCAISPDNNFIVSSSSDHLLKVWDARNGAERFTLFGHTASVTACAIDSDSSFIVSASRDKTLKVWDARSGAERLTLVGHEDTVNDCAISGDGTLIVSASSDRTLRVWDARSGAQRLILHGHLSPVTACAVSDDCSFIVSESSDSFKIWDARSGRQKGKREIWGEGRSISSERVTISMDGDNLLVWNSKDKTLEIFGIESGDKRIVLDRSMGVGSQCAVSRDRSFIISISANNSLNLWDVKSSYRRLTFTGHRYWITSCAISPDGSFVVSASFDKTLKVWNAKGENDTNSVSGHKAWVSDCAVSREEPLVVSAAWDRDLVIWDSNSGTQYNRIDSRHRDNLTSCAINRDGSLIISASFDRTLHVWDAKKRSRRSVLSGHTASVTACAISFDDSFIVSSSWDKTLKVWDARNGAERFTLFGHTASVTACAIDSDSSFIVSASRDKTLKVWDARSGAERLTLVGHEDTVNDCAISGDGTLIVSASSDRTLRVWDARSGAQRLILHGHLDDVMGCAVSPDNSLIASASFDRTLKVWEARSASCLTTLHLDGRLSDCEWSINFKQLVAVGSGGVYFLQLER